MITKEFFGRKFFWPQNCQKWSKFGHFLPKWPFLSVFGLYLPNAAINFHNFWYGNYSCGLLWNNYSVYTGKILRWPKFGHFFAKIDSFESFWPINSKRSYESSLFLVWKLFLWSSLRKSYSICRENSYMAKFWPFKTKFWPFFGQNWQFWEFLTYNFQTQLWIFLIFGMNFFEFWLFPGNQSYCVLFMKKWI